MEVFRIPYWFCPGKTPEWFEKEKERRKNKTEIARHILISYEDSVEGVVFDEFTDSHIFKGVYEFDVNLPLIRVLDFGGTNASLFAQKDKYGRFTIFRELVLGPSSGTPDQAKIVKAITAEYDVRQGCRDACDPAGKTGKSAAPEITDVQVCREYGINPQYDRIESIRDRVQQGITLIKTKLSERIGGIETIRISESGCPTLIDAFRSGYRWKTDRQGNILNEVDEKHPYEDVMDCCRYILQQFSQVQAQPDDMDALNLRTVHFTPNRRY